MQKIHWIDLGGVNAYLVENQGDFLLIDTGGHMFMDKEYVSRCDVLVEELKRLGVREDNLKMIVLTHGDNDHANNAKYIHETFQAPIAMHKEDRYMVNNPDYKVYKDNSKYQSIIFKIVFKFMDKKIDRLMQKVYADFKGFDPDIYVREGDSFDAYGFDLRVIETPGHTKGSISLVDSKGNVFVGDVYANNSKPALAMNARDFAMNARSAQRIMDQEPCKIYPGHGQPFEPKH